MKTTSTTSTSPLKKAGKGGFTLIEMIGVLAVIAILAALLIPKIFEAINNARVNNAAITIQTVKTAIADHYAKFGSLAVDGRATPTVITDSSVYDEILLGEGFIDKPFAVKIGDGVRTPSPNTGNRVQLRAAIADSPDDSNSAYNLDGQGTVNKATGSHVVEAVITGVSMQDAKDLNDRIDGALLGEQTIQDPNDANISITSDTRGRVKYAAAGAGGTTTVYVYITHR